MNTPDKLADYEMPYGLSDELFARLVALRRWFHQHPELAFKEADTAQRIIV